MEKEKSRFSFSSTIYTAIISMTFTILGSLSLAYLNQKESTLEYEILPISSFKADSSQITILNIRIVNSGNKECENITFAPGFGDSIKVSDYTFQKSSSPIQVIPVLDSLSHQTYYSIPYLNPNEQIICSFLFKRIVNANEISVDLRSKGATGVEIKDEPSHPVTNVLYWGTVSMMGLTIALVVFIIFHQRKVIRYQLTLQNMSDYRIKAIKQVLSDHGLFWDNIKDEVKATQKKIALEAEGETLAS